MGRKDVKTGIREVPIIPATITPTGAATGAEERRFFRAAKAKNRKGTNVRFPVFGILEREKSLELSTSTLARLRSTN